MKGERTRAADGTRKRPLHSAAPLAMTLCAASVGAVVMAGVRTSQDLAQKELRRLREQSDELSREIEKLSVQVDELMAPERIEREARSRGMIYPHADQILKPPAPPGSVGTAPPAEEPR